jgi:hypothetical protein
MNLNKKYLIKPFMKRITEKGFSTANNVFNMIVGTTGLGKTFTTFNTFIPHLFNKKNLDLVIFTYPTTEVYDKDDAIAVLRETSGVQLVDNIDDAIFYLGQGIKVFLPVTHQMILANKYFLDVIISAGYKMAWFVDEPHTWLGCSSSEHYKDVTGNYNALYGGVLYKMVAKVSAITPYVFGTTATPTNEHKHLLLPVGDMEFKIINDYPSTREIISACGWMGGVSYFDIENPYEVGHIFSKFFGKHIEKNNLFGKRTMMISCEAANGSMGYTIENILDLLKDEYISLGDFTSQTIVQITNDFKGYVNIVNTNFNNGTYQLSYEKVDERTLIRNLNDPNHPSNIVLFVNKGKCGMNVHNIKSYFSFRKTNKKTSSNLKSKEIVDTPIQTLGRMMRIWTGVSNREFVKDWGYNLTEYVKSLNSVERNNLLELNSYDVCVPNNDMWKEAIRVVRSKLNPSKTMASDWMVKICS